MSASLFLPAREARAGQTLAPILATVHDGWMADAGRSLGPITDPQATFFQRWAAVRYLWDRFAERFDLEQDLLNQLHPFVVAEARERLWMQVVRLNRLRRDLDQLAHRQGTAPDLARTARDLLEALRLWYAEIELAVGQVSLDQLSREANCLINRLSGWSEAPGDFTSLETAASCSSGASLTERRYAGSS